MSSPTSSCATTKSTRTGSRRLAWLVLWTLALATGCGNGSTGAIISADAVVKPTDATDAIAPDSASPPTPTAPVTVATWNVYNFSKWGEEEYRLQAFAEQIDGLEADFVALQELAIKDGTDGDPPQAWDALLEALPDHEGVRAPWEANDTCVGLVYRPATVTILSSETIFSRDWYPFPRAPLIVDLEVTRGGGTTALKVIVLHLKAFGDEESRDRRKAGCEKIEEYVRQRPQHHWLILGDFNDNPFAADADNVFTETFLGYEPSYYFVTSVLPPETVSSVGWYHYVNGQKIKGQFLDHVIVTGPLYEGFSTVTPEVLGVPSSQYKEWENSYSDHFPVVVDFKP